mmetsp:Transcript_12658/g.23849  ORF Transcript_12658/g.23849 Transcript_12658/m.23849 type:complete len:206 (-) Transcript_12658:314-931(-)
MQKAGMVLQVLPNKGGHEVVGVVISSLHPESDRHLGLLRSGHECQGLELVHVAHQEVVSGPAIAEDVQIFALVVGDKLRGIVLLPALLVWAEVEVEGLLSPRDLRRIADGSEGRDRRIPVWVLQSNRECSMATHGVPRDGALGSDREVGLHEIRELLDDIIIHVVVGLVLLGGRVEVESSSHAEVVGVRILVRNAVATRRRVWHH